MHPRYPRAVTVHDGRSRSPEPSSPGALAYSSYDPYSTRLTRDRHVSPRASADRVIPISSETYINGVLIPSKSRGTYDIYASRPRRATNDTGAPYRITKVTATDVLAEPHRAVVHNSSGTSPGPLIRPGSKHDRDYFIVPARSGSGYQHKKIYSVDEGRTSRLVEDTTKPGRKRGDFDGDPYRNSSDRSQRYHLSGPIAHQNESDGYDYEYTDPRGMYRDTEPRWRPRRGSADALHGRERPASILEGFSSKSGNRELGQPSAIRGTDKLGNSLGRANTVRERLRSPPRNMERTEMSYDEDNLYAIPPRMRLSRHDSVTRNERPESYSLRSEDYKAQDRQGAAKSTRKFEDTQVASRGFGIRSDPADALRWETSIDRKDSHAFGLSQSARRDYQASNHHDEHRRVLNWREQGRPSERVTDFDEVRPTSSGNNDIIAGRDEEIRRERDRAYDDADHITHRRKFQQEPERADLPQEALPAREDLNGRGFRVQANGKERSNQSFSGEQYGRRADLVGAVAGGTAVIAAKEMNNSWKPDRPLKFSDSSDRDAHGHKVRSPKPDILGQTLESGRSSESSDLDERGAVTRFKRVKNWDSRSSKSVGGEEVRQRRYVEKEDVDATLNNRAETQSLDADEEFRRRVQLEKEHAVEQRRNALPSEGETEKDISRVMINSQDYYDHNTATEQGDFSGSGIPSTNDPGLKGDGHIHAESSISPEQRVSIIAEPPSDEPAELVEDRENRVHIVEPPKEKEVPKGILRRPTEKFPEDPNPVREGVAPIKGSAKKGSPAGARWTRINRQLVNPEALTEAKERFEERQDCVIVLRVLTREEIQRLTNRTKEIRDERYEAGHRERRHRKQRDYEEDHVGDGEDVKGET